MILFLKLLIALPLGAFIAYQNKHHTRSIWDNEEATPTQGGKTTKD